MRKSDRQYCWSTDLPIELLTKVTRRLSYRDVVRFGVVCKTWKKAIPDDRRLILCGGYTQNKYKRRATEIYCEAMYSDLSRGSFWFRNLVQKQEGLRRRPTLKTALCCPNSGWLFLFGSDHTTCYAADLDTFTFFVHNPLRKETMELTLPPQLLKEDLFWCKKVELATMTTTPTSPDCVIFILWLATYSERQRYFSITTYNQQDGRWNMFKVPPFRDERIKRTGYSYLFPCFDGEFRDMVYVDGVLYFVIAIDSSEIVLGTFDAALQHWVLVNNPISTLKLPYCPTHLKLSKSNGKLILTVYHRQRGVFYLEVYGFDYSSQENWKRVDTSLSLNLAPSAVGARSLLSNLPASLDS